MANSIGLTEEQEKLIRESVINNLKLQFQCSAIPETEEVINTIKDQSENLIKRLFNGEHTELLNYYLKQNDANYISEDTKCVLEKAKNGEVIDLNLRAQIKNLVELCANSPTE